jgi:hypothetical protein
MLSYLIGCWVVDPHHFSVDPDPDFNCNAIRIKRFALVRIRNQIRILLLAKVMRVCDHLSTDSAGSILSIHASIVSVHSSSRLNIEPQKAPGLCSSGSGSSFSPLCIPEPASKNDEDPDSQPWLLDYSLCIEYIHSMSLFVVRSVY